MASYRYEAYVYFNPFYTKKYPILARAFRAPTVVLGYSNTLEEIRKIAHKFFYSNIAFCVPALSVHIMDDRLGFERKVKCDLTERGPHKFELHEHISVNDVWETDERTGDINFIYADGSVKSKSKSKVFRGRIPQLVPRFE